MMVMLNIVLFAFTYKTTEQKAKIEMYAVTAILFVLLYNASAGVVLFWITTNAFYLIKYFLTKYKTFRNIFKYVLSGLGLSLIVVYFCTKLLLYVIVGGLLQIPIIYYLVRYKLWNKFKKPTAKKKVTSIKIKKSQFYIEVALIIFLIGVFIPSTYVAASPQEYISSKLFFDPLYYVLGSFLTAFGYMMVWFNVMYSFASEKNKYRINKLLMISIVVMFVNYMFFGLNLGTISFNLKYDFGLDISVLEAVINGIVVIAIIIISSFVYARLKEYVSFILSILIVVLSVMSTYNVITSVSQVNDYKNGSIAESKLSYTLSTTGNNVVVIMLDRALGQYLPFIFNEKPELAEKFDGFTHYQNTISFGYFTNLASPALLGGYEYTPVEMNKRDDELLKDKNNEANLIMPRIFSDAGYNVTVADPVYINYKFLTNLSIYDKYKNIDAFYSIGKFVDDDQIKFAYDFNMTNFFRFSFMKTLPLALQYIFYDEGNYNNV
ncbi:MAG: hypothetical protein J6J33_01520, partial [Clostridia bacterium]|nr:hypothetical protein [Clostridia bacterium]